ncbi:LysR family transcriptional regulator [Actinomadura sp. HBU206391]|uniref:LysR family transcriptional regulator n=1 Tax=Actinomadura sp. HBU206391 TaxID=2731692 RepID=UPI0016507F69|nr:LysR substrate-binding domain-containing protein [Actinomadura sp. HBU206391]MBC6463121.1 LysR family transcriptional regulator [Actinomadura sp. HBU206391]
MKLHQITALVAIADTGSFTNAARALSVGQSAISHAIAGLEAELGVPLMWRDRGGVQFTDAGRRVLDHARSIVVELDQIGRIRQALHPASASSIRIGTSQSFAVRLLPPLMTYFKSRFPEVKITLREGPDGRIAELLRTGEIDIGVVMLPKRDLLTVPLLRDEMYALLPTAHRLGSGGRIRIRQLDGEPLIMPVGGVEAMIVDALRAKGIEPRITHRIRDLNTVFAMVAAGLGTTVIPGLVLPSRLPDLRPIPFAPVWVRHLAIGVHPSARESPPVTTFIGAAQALARRWEPPVQRVAS